MKKMIAMVLFVSTAIGFTACSSDDNEPIKVESKVEGTWESDQLSYTMGGKTFSHNYIDFPGDKAVYQNDILILTGSTAQLTEHFVSEGTPTTIQGSVSNGVITFNKEGYTPRTINGVTDGQLTLTYDYTMRGATLPITVTYNKKK